MEYEGTVYRPPSEARSLIIQVTVGCAHNRCTFCNMYRVKKFRVRTKEEIMKDLDLVHVMPVAEFQDIVIAGNRFSELQNRTLSLEELCMHPLVSMESGTTTRLFWDNLFEEQGLDLRPSIEVSSNDLIAPTVSHNLGIGFVPSEFARNYLLNYRVFQLHLNIPIPKRQILVLQNPMRPLTPAAQTFLDMLKQPVQESIGNEQPILLHP